ncbi:putative tbc domain [Phaeomoniella chlamydospora]|uniref:Putative tbc domain n=1 Tax=Phaeomoniella chlamydospora TaxID=158046 RepID=A0A0G2DWH0_PHACM|nr:putative tbc domain [Phaeomoniella chlamydospora]
MPLLQDGQAERLRSLDQALASQANFESWLLAHPTSTLFLPPPQPPLSAARPCSLSEKTPPPTTAPGAVSHSQIRRKLVHHKQDYLQLQHRHARDLHSTITINKPSCLSDRRVYTISEEEDESAAVEIHSFDTVNNQSLSAKSTYRPFRQSYTGRLLNRTNKFTVVPAPIITPPASQFIDSANGRCLTEVLSWSGDEMTTVASVPDSPPDLSGSKSSKSSSCHSSSQLSSPDGLVSDVSNFEDIGLEDDAQPPAVSAVSLNRHAGPKRPSMQKMPPSAARTTTSTTVSQAHDIMSKKRNYPSIRGQVDRAVSEKYVEGIAGRPGKLTGSNKKADTIPGPYPESSTPPTSRKDLPPRTSSLSSPPPGPHYQATFRNTRARSWNLAMSDLSEEARVLTEALEYHADDMGRKHEDNVQQGVRSTRPSMEEPKQSSRGIVELPPLQKGNVMIDPLPISKEKEKVLTRTRPSWLPPKDPKEERRHLKEYQRMMAASIDAERKRESKDRTAKLEKEEARSELDKIWETYIYPDWGHVISEHRTRELWWQGISPKMRGLVWGRAVGNELALNETSYAKALQRAKDLRASEIRDIQTKRSRQWLKEIVRDAATVYPDLNLFQVGSPMYKPLVNLLSAYVMYRSDVGYMHGLHLVAANILLQISDPASAFVCMANALNRPLSLAFLTGDPAATSRHYSLAKQTLAYKFPALHDCLFNSADEKGLGLQAEEVFEPMFRTLLSNGLDPERLARVWDCWVFEGDRTIIRAGTAILGLYEGQICLIDGDDLEEKRQKVRSLLGWGPWGRAQGSWNFRDLDGGEDGFINKVRDAGKLK